MGKNAKKDNFVHLCQILEDGHKRKEMIFRMTQKELRLALYEHLKKLGRTPVLDDGFVYSAGTHPVLLIAHMDTVHDDPVEAICKDNTRNIWMSPQGIGGDDRCGIYIILRLIEKFDCHVLFCEDEEVGGVGAKKFTRSRITPEVNFIVEFDRMGSDDAVFYACDNKKFTDFIEAHDFTEAFGSFSDISVVAPHLGVAAVNLSSGYHNPHSLSEYVNFNQVEKTIDRAGRILNDAGTRFEYVKTKTPGGYWFGGSGSRYSYPGPGWKWNAQTHSYEQTQDDDDEKEDCPILSDEFTFPLEVCAVGYITTNDGSAFESGFDGEYFISELGMLYEEICDGVIEQVEDGCEAFDDAGNPVHYNAYKAVTRHVIVDLPKTQTM